MGFLAGCITYSPGWGTAQSRAVRKQYISPGLPPRAMFRVTTLRVRDVPVTVIFLFSLAGDANATMAAVTAVRKRTLIVIFHTALQCVQVCQQVLDLLRGQHISECRHVGFAVLHHLGDPVVVGGQPAGQVLLLEHMFQAGALQVLGGVSFVAACAIVVEYPAAGRLLRIEPKLSVTFASLHVTAA